MKIYKKLSFIKPNNKICLIGHINPDADALASMVVFKSFLNKYFKIKTIDIFAECSEPPYICADILDNEKLNPEQTNYDIAIMLDCPNTDRLGKYTNLYLKAKHKIVIDHHQTNNYSGDINIVEMVSSTCEIIYSILKEFKYKLSDSEKGKLYAGIITDTNNFSVGNFNDKTFEIVSDLVKNIDKNAIYNHFLSNTTMKNMQLLSLAIQNIKCFNDGKIIISHISHNEANNLKAAFEDFTGIINKLSSINSSYLVCLIYPKENEFYVSLRAREGFDVSILAKENSGGGHIGASAFLSKKSIEEIEEIVIKNFKHQLENNKYTKKKLF